ncbi:MAG TPA: sugar phosphate nucleotidyltransferase [Bryobacteraceae bacterium]|nr:sugar phosphate nucleotidyltransferase [Bryobacteraceae bacterium]
MPEDFGREHQWGVILAGGEGIRLRSLTRLISGDDRPKQFCPLIGGLTLLAHTRQRIAPCIAPDRTLFVLLNSHERFYAEELRDVRSPQTLVQPCERGTLPAILLSLLRIVQLDEQAAVAFFPSDHYYADERKFMAGVKLAFGFAETSPETVILLGAAATRAEVGYGWLEAEPAISTHSSRGLLRVNGFWEKPSQHVAKNLLERGCIWNTFVMIGRATAFLDTIRSAQPELYRIWEPLVGRHEPAMSSKIMKTIYDRLPTTDFSRSVLGASPEKLGVLNLGDVGWSDLGDPGRVLRMWSETGTENAWGHARFAVPPPSFQPVDAGARNAREQASAGLYEEVAGERAIQMSLGGDHSLARRPNGAATTGIRSGKILQFVQNLHAQGG